MKISKIITVISVTALCVYACKKDKKTEEQLPTPLTASTPASYDNYSALKIGNYWIYQQFKIDTLGNVTPQNIYDSCYVEKDTLIRGRTFFKVYTPHIIYNYTYMNDSLHYIIDKTGAILFSSIDFNSTFYTYYATNSPNDSIYKLTGKMADKDLAVSVPAGSFVTSNFKRTYDFYPNWRPYGNISKTRISNTRFAKNIGIISETMPFFLSNPNYSERRLIRYHVN